MIKQFYLINRWDVNWYLGQTPGFLAGPSGIRAGWVLETKSRLGAE